MNTTIRLSDILGRGVAVEWYEAVALVREVVDRVRDNLAGRGVPELDQVQLSADGAVTLAGAPTTDEPVRRLGQLLQACLVQAEPPVQLRLIVAQATAPEPGYTSLRDYSEALAYFERPDRPTVLRSLYERAQAAPVHADEPTPTLDSIAPLREPGKNERENPAVSTRAATSRRSVAALAAAVVLVVAATAYSQYQSTAPTRNELSALAVKASDAVGTTLVKGISAVSETVGLGRLVPADAPAGVAPPPVVVAPPVKSVSARKAPPAERPDSQPFRIFDLGVIPTAPILAPRPVSIVAETDAAVSTTVVVSATIYSASDEDVLPPIGVRPQLPHVLPSDVRREELSQIELLVLPDGTVGSVKLLGARRGVLDGMLLSAAKAWQFRPAEKDGHPVSYLKTVWLARD